MVDTGKNRVGGVSSQVTVHGAGVVRNVSIAGARFYGVSPAAKLVGNWAIATPDWNNAVLSGAEPAF
jgi:hypothetical protein